MYKRQALNLSIKVDAVDFKLEDQYFKMFFNHDMLYEKIELIEKNSLEIDSSFIELLPKNFVEVSEENFLTINKLIDSLEDLEDIQNVYSNYRVEKN